MLSRFQNWSGSAGTPPARHSTAGLAATQRSQGLVLQAGPIRGSLAEAIPEPRANAEMAALGGALPNNPMISPEREHSNPFAFEGPAASLARQRRGPGWIPFAGVERHRAIPVVAGDVAGHLTPAALPDTRR